MSKFAVKTLTLVVLAILVSACGKRPQVVTGIQASSKVEAQDVFVSLKADLDLGKMSFPNVALPIIHPRGQTQIGTVELVPVLGGKNQILVTVNLSELIDIQAVEARLPNGNLIPLVGLNPTIVIPLGAGAQLYLTSSKEAIALGVAVPIKTFDNMGARVGSANLFPTFSIEKVLGAAGVFTGAKAGQSGFAIVADVTEYVNMQDIYVPQAAGDLDYMSQIPSKAKEDKINSMMLDLNNKAKRLELRR